MPRLTPAHRDARRAAIVAAARRCFSRDGFHQTSMPDIAAEAGVSTGAPYRYFSSKDELIIEIAHDAFEILFEPARQSLDREKAVSVADLVAASIEPVAHPDPLDAAGNPIPIQELLRCGVQAWGELLRNPTLHRSAVTGLDDVRTKMAHELEAGQRAGYISPRIDVNRAPRVIIALLHGFILQRVAFGLDDVTGFTEDVRLLVAEADVLEDAQNPDLNDSKNGTGP